MNSFGTNFVIVSDVVQPVPGLGIGNPPERVIHHATIRRGLKEYVVLRSETSNKLYIEEVERHRATFALRRIESDAEWADLYRLCEEAGLLTIGEGTKYAS